MFGDVTNRAIQFAGCQQRASSKGCDNGIPVTPCFCCTKPAVTAASQA